MIFFFEKVRYLSYYYDADVAKSDVFRKMSRVEATRKQKSAMEALARIGGDLAMA